MSLPNAPWKPPPQGKPPFRTGPWLWLLVIASVGLLVGFLVWRFPGALSSGHDSMRIFYLIGLLALVSSGVLAGRRMPLKRAAKQVLAWIGIGLVLVIGYGFRDELGFIGDRVMGELAPHSGIETGEGAVSFRASVGGHFYIEAEIDGVQLRMLVDTGATQVMLSLADARRLGFDVENLSFTGVAGTANGTVRTASVRLRQVVVGPITVRDVRASVNAGEMDGSLLGMSFLERLGGYEVSGNTLTLYR